MSFLSDTRVPVQPGAQSQSSFDRFVSVGAGGAMVGASLGGPVGAVVGGLVGLAFADMANRAERERVHRGPSLPR